MEITEENMTQLKKDGASQGEILFSRDVCDTQEDVWEYFEDENCPELSFEPIDFTKFPRKIVVSVNWKDQGWGHRKGALQIVLRKKEDKKVVFLTNFPYLANHD
jgi:hypothetical protein